MIQWNFYLSGILYGKIQEENQQLTLQQRIYESGKWSERIPFTEKEDENFSGLCGRSILGFFRRKKEYETEIAAKPEAFTTESQEIFTKRREDSYIQRSKKFPMDLFYDEEGIYSVLMSGRDFTAVLVKKAWRNGQFFPDGRSISRRVRNRRRVSAGNGLSGRFYRIVPGAYQRR